MARIRLSDEALAIEAVIETGSEHDALASLLEAEPVLGRKPEYRYLRHLFDHVFSTRPTPDLLRDLVALVSEQPDLSEASALLAELYDRAGEPKRADLFAQVSLESDNPRARRRASAVLKRHGISVAAQDAESEVADADVAPAGDPATDLTAWFEHARKELVQRRTETYGVRSGHSVIDMLLESGAKVALGPSPFAPEPLPLTRDSLVRIDESIVQARKAQGGGSASRSDVSRTNAAAGFLLAVVLHELAGTAVETAANDGGCKVMVPSGAGARPLLVASAFSEGAGPGLAQTFDRLAASTAISARTGPQSVPASVRRLSGSFSISGTGEPPVSSGPRSRGRPPPPAKRTVKFGSPVSAAQAPTLPAIPVRQTPATTAATVAASHPVTISARSGGTLPPPSLGPSLAGAAAARVPTPVSTPAPSGTISSSPPKSAPVVVSRDELALTRPEVEAQTSRRLERPVKPGDRPAIDMTAVANAFVETPLGYEIAARSGSKLVPTPNHVEALESYLSSTRGNGGGSAWQPSDAEESLILSWGAFLGEALIATYGGVWESDPNAPSDPRLFRVVCDARVAAWPVMRVYLRLRDGAAHDLIQFVLDVGRLLG